MPLFNKLAILILAMSAMVSCGDKVEPQAPVPAETNSLAQAPRTIVWIVLDTLRADALGCYGNPRETSPEIDALAARGIVIEDAYAHAPWTRPSAASMLSSLHPPEHGIRSEDPEDRLPEAAQTLAEQLQAHGFRTAAISENPHVQSATGFAQGFDLFLGKPLWQSDVPWMLEQARTLFAAARSTSSPLFLYVHALDPHDPYQPSAADREAILGAQHSPDPDVEEGRAFRCSERLQSGGTLEERDLAILRGLYEAEVRSSDRFVGALLDALQNESLLEQSLIILTSDHGEEFMEHGALRHGDQLFDESLHVPLVMAGPSIQRGRVRCALARHIDIAPTILELLDLPQPGTWRGRSLAAALHGKPIAPAYLYAETRWREVETYALRDARWKWMHDARANTAVLYDLERDPGEFSDSAAQHVEPASQLHQDLELLRRAFREVSNDASASAEATYDPETWEALQKLGYTGGAKSTPEKH